MHQTRPGMLALVITLMLGILLAFPGLALAENAAQPEQAEEGWQWEYLLGAAAVLVVLVFLLSLRPGRTWRRELREGRQPAEEGPEREAGETAGPPGSSAPGGGSGRDQLPR